MEFFDYLKENYFYYILLLVYLNFFSFLKIKMYEVLGVAVCLLLNYANLDSIGLNYIQSLLFSLFFITRFITPFQTIIQKIINLIPASISLYLLGSNLINLEYSFYLVTFIPVIIIGVILNKKLESVLCLSLFLLSFASQNLFVLCLIFSVIYSLYCFFVLPVIPPNLKYMKIIVSLGYYILIVSVLREHTLIGEINIVCAGLILGKDLIYNKISLPFGKYIE